MSQPTSPHLVVLMCTGFYTPGIDFEIMKRCGVPTTTEAPRSGSWGASPESTASNSRTTGWPVSSNTGDRRTSNADHCAMQSNRRYFPCGYGSSPVDGAWRLRDQAAVFVASHSSGDPVIEDHGVRQDSGPASRPGGDDSRSGRFDRAQDAALRQSDGARERLGRPTHLDLHHHRQHRSIALIDQRTRDLDDVRIAGSGRTLSMTKPPVSTSSGRTGCKNRRSRIPRPAMMLQDAKCPRTASR